MNARELAAWRAAGFQCHIAKPFASPVMMAIVEDLAGLWVERRVVSLARRDWPTTRERRSERRAEPTTVLQGDAGGYEHPLRELSLLGGRQLG